MKHLCRPLALMLAALLALAALASAETAGCPQLETGVREIQKHGNLILDISGIALLGQGYEYGDIITVNFGDFNLDMPICSDYSNVDVGAPVCRVTQADNADDSHVTLAINSGDLATTSGIATRTTIEEDPGYRWEYAEAYANGITVTLSLKEKGGYLERMALQQLPMSNVRTDYPDLTDEQYANFRNVATTGMGTNALFRSSSPINSDYNRNQEADTAVNAYGIRTVLNLADSESVMKGYEGYAQTYYSQLDIIPLDLIVEFESDSFRNGLAEGFRFLADHEGPYLVHCAMGKDRAGFTSAILECPMGASEDEVVSDYMVSYYNYYGIEPGDEKYELIANSNIRKSLAKAFGVEDLSGADLAASAEAYLRDIGMTDDEIAAMKDRLGTDIQ